MQTGQPGIEACSCSCPEIKKGEIKQFTGIIPLDFRTVMLDLLVYAFTRDNIKETRRQNASNLFTDFMSLLQLGHESVPKIVINNTTKIFLTAISILVISKHNSFRVLFDKTPSINII